MASPQPFHVRTIKPSLLRHVKFTCSLKLEAKLSLRHADEKQWQGDLLEVQYDPTVIQPREVVAPFEPWDGEYIPLSTFESRIKLPRTF